MKKIDSDGLLLCDIQSRTFEISREYSLTSSEIFIRRFMNSNIVKYFDSLDILQTNLQPKNIIDCITEQYGSSKYGKIKYEINELHWIGYIYRYFCYTHDISSKRAYKIIKPKELRDVYLPYHSLDPKVAIERILEAKHVVIHDIHDINYQFEVYKRVRNEK